MKQLLKLFLPLILTLPLVTSCSNDDDRDNGTTERNANRNDTSQEPALQRLEFPHVKGGDSRVIIHTNNDRFGINYSVEWDCTKRSQRWSCYQMFASNRKQKTSRYYSDYNQYPMDPELPDLQLKFFEDISGVNGALQGKPGYSSTSGTLYAQQTQNATTSLLDLLDSFSTFIIDGAYKDVKNIQQFYDDKRVFNIT